MNTYAISAARPLILASASPRRTDLLRRAMIPFRAVPSLADERGNSPVAADLAVQLAMKKAMEIGDRVKGHWILGADTLVVAGDEILGKPEENRDAERMLRLLSGKEHLVITGFVLLDHTGRAAHREAPVTRVRIKKLSDEEIAGYIATGEPFGKAGGYAVQGLGTFIVEGIVGSYTNVVGLSLFHVIRALVNTGAIGGFPLSVKSMQSESKKR